MLSEFSTGFNALMFVSLGYNPAVCFEQRCYPIISWKYFSFIQIREENPQLFSAYMKSNDRVDSVTFFLKIHELW